MLYIQVIVSISSEAINFVELSLLLFSTMTFINLFLVFSILIVVQCPPVLLLTIDQ